jgi:hypothetical protein
VEVFKSVQPVTSVVCVQTVIGLSLRRNTDYPPWDFVSITSVPLLSTCKTRCKMPGPLPPLSYLFSPDVMNVLLQQCVWNNIVNAQRKHQCCRKFYIRGSVHRNSKLIKSNKIQHYAEMYLLLSHSICFGCSLHPSSGVYKTVIAAFGTDHTIWERGQGHVGSSLLRR